MARKRIMNLSHGLCFFFLFFFYYTVKSTFAFLYQVSRGLSPSRVSVSSMYAHRSRKSECVVVTVSFPVIER